MSSSRAGQRSQGRLPVFICGSLSLVPLAFCQYAHYLEAEISMEIRKAPHLNLRMKFKGASSITWDDSSISQSVFWLAAALAYLHPLKTCWMWKFSSPTRWLRTVGVGVGEDSVVHRLRIPPDVPDGCPSLRITGLKSWCVLVIQPCPILFNPMVQARILESVAILFSRGASQPRDQTCVSLYSRQILYHLGHQGSLSDRKFVFDICGSVPVL